MRGRDAVLDQGHLPLALRVEHGALDQLAVQPFEAAAPVGIAQHREIRAARAGGRDPKCAASGRRSPCRGSPCSRSRPPARPRRRGGRCRGRPARSGSPRSACRRPRGWTSRCTALLELLRVVVGDDRAVGVEQVALAVALEDRAEVPAVAVVVGELRVLQRRVQFRHALEELGIGPQPARGRALGVAVVARRAPRRRSGTSALSATWPARRTRSPTSCSRGRCS